VEIHHSALKHGVAAKDAIRAATDYLIAFDLDEENPGRQLRLGFGAKAQLLETVVLTLDNGTELIIHAMKARASYLDLLP
jgi:hypothetical protein